MKKGFYFIETVYFTAFIMILECNGLQFLSLLFTLKNLLKKLSNNFPNQLCIDVKKNQLILISHYPMWLLLQVNIVLSGFCCHFFFKHCCFKRCKICFSFKFDFSDFSA